jgi:RNA polymerase sigma factor (sigma-70 family)
LAFLKNISSATPDSDLVQQYRETSDLQVLGELYGRYMDLVYGVCLKYLEDGEDAKDAVLNIFEELVTKLLKYEVENFKSWLYGLAKNHCLMRLRSLKGKEFVKIDPALVQSEASVHLNGVLEREENLNQLHYCLGQLMEEQRQVIELFYLQGKCYNEIVELTKMDWNRVRSYIQNGRRNLKICMDKQIIKSTV